MSRIYCPQCGNETAEYWQQAVVKTLAQDAGQQFSEEVSEEYKIFKCCYCRACFVFLGVQKEGIN